MTEQFGLPYKGSKNKLARKIVDLFPKRKHFYDLFCGGCAVTHAALLLRNFETYTMNDVIGWMPELFIDAINGKYKNENRWISREDFFKLKDTDAYVACCWSFGNDLRSYLYSKEIEELKRAWHYAIFFDDFETMKKLTGIDLSPIENIKRYLKKYLTSARIIRKFYNPSISENSSRLQSLETFERLQRLQRLQSLQSKNLSYDEVEILPDSVIYCDIPYKDTNTYSLKDKTIQPFDHEKFYDWCRKQKEPVFISSYEMPEDFITIAEFKHRSILCATENIEVVEKVFVPSHQGWLKNAGVWPEFDFN